MCLYFNLSVKTLEAGFAHTFPILNLFFNAVNEDLTELQRFTLSKRRHDVIETKKVKSNALW